MQKMRRFSNTNRLLLKVALISFCLGTLLFLTALYTKQDALLIIGFLYVVTAVIVNLICFATVFINLFNPKQSIQESFVTLILLSLNIPVAIFYFSILFP